MISEKFNVLTENKNVVSEVKNQNDVMCCLLYGRRLEYGKQSNDESAEGNSSDNSGSI